MNFKSSPAAVLSFFLKNLETCLRKKCSKQIIYMRANFFFEKHLYSEAKRPHENTTPRKQATTQQASKGSNRGYKTHQTLCHCTLTGQPEKKQKPAQPQHTQKPIRTISIPTYHHPPAPFLANASAKELISLELYSTDKTSI